MEASTRVALEATHQAALRVVSLEDLKAFALPSSNAASGKDPSAKNEL
jgi:hypothetical protein